MKLVGDLGGFFFSGGEPWRLVATLRDSPVLAAVVGRWESGAAVGGSSAGSEALVSSPAMLGSNGTSWGGLVYGARPHQPNTVPAPDILTYDPQGGLAIATGFLIDAHFR